MDEIELFVIGAVFAMALAASMWRVQERLARGLVDLSILLGLAGVLYLLGLDVMRNAIDFLSADAGVILVVGALGHGGLLPPTLSED